MVKRTDTSKANSARGHEYSPAAAAALRVLKDPRNSKAAKTAAGFSLTQRFDSGSSRTLAASALTQRPNKK
ncbi:MAG: hypothetical protein ACYYKD_11120 [Rhodospirillales bacterium]